MQLVKALFVIVSTQVCFAENLNPQQIADLLSAAKQQYVNVDIEFQKKGYSKIDDKMKLNHDGIIIYRSTPDRIYYSHDGIHFPYADKKDVSVKAAKKIAITSKYSKRLSWGDNTTGYEGMVTHDNLEGDMLATPLKLLFEIFETYNPDELASRIVDVARTESGNYVIKVERSKKRKLYVNITINPQYNFIPSKYEFVHNDEVGYVTEFDDFKEVSTGIWLPFMYTYTYPDEATGTLTIRNASINTKLQNSELDFDFPTGTFVIDRIANMNYTVGEALDDTDPLNEALEDLSKTPTDDLEHALDFKSNQRPVSDSQLKSSHEKNKDISRSKENQIQNELQNSNSAKKLVWLFCLVAFLSLLAITIFVYRKR